MIPLSFFLGLPLDPKLQSHLGWASQYEKTLFISGGLYLEEIEIKGSTFLGKKLDAFLTFEELKSAEAHVRSLFSRLVPSYPVVSLSLIAIESQFHESRRDHHHERGRGQATR